VALVEYLVLERAHTAKGDGHPEEEGSILIFLPGMAEITTLVELIVKCTVVRKRGAQSFRILPLHSLLTSEEQSRVFDRAPPGVIKVGGRPPTDCWCVVCCCGGGVMLLLQRCSVPANQSPPIKSPRLTLGALTLHWDANANSFGSAYCRS